MLEEVKEILGYKSNNTLYKLLHNGSLKYGRQPNGKYLIPKHSLVEYLNGHCYNVPYNN